MIFQATLPLLPVLSPAGRHESDAKAVRSRAGVESYELKIRDLPIFVKPGGMEGLVRRLQKAALQGEPVAIGTATDPYQPAERHYEVTRSILQVFSRVQGLEISIATKSTLILRDLELLTELDRRHSVTINVTIPTTDPAVARRIEPQAPEPRARLRTVRRLAAAGIATKILCPVMPGINNGEAVLRPLFEEVREAGAFDVEANTLYLRPGARARFMPWLHGRRDLLNERDQDRLLATFRRLRLEHGFPVAVPGRG